MKNFIDPYPSANELTTSGYLLEEHHFIHRSTFNTIYKCYFKPLYRKILSLVKDEDIADELVQDLFLKVWQKMEDINTLRSFKAYLYKIAHNLVYDYFRKVAQDKRLSDQLLLQASEYYLHTDQLLEDKESRQILAKAIDQLTPQRKLVFTHCKLEGNSYQHASETLGISVATVNTHITHSFKIIRTYMLKSYE